MIIPDDAYETGILTVLPIDEFNAKQAVHEYEAIRNICIAKQRHMIVERFVYMLAAVPLALNDLQLEIDKEPLRFLFWISVALYVFAFICVLFLKNMIIPACFLPFYIAEALLIDDSSYALFTLILPLVSLGILTYTHETSKRYVRSKPDYPAFRSVTVKVLREEMSNDRSVPLPAPKEEDPYADILGAVAPEPSAPVQLSADRSVPDPGEPEEDPYADMLGDMSE